MLWTGMQKLEVLFWCGGVFLKTGSENIECGWGYDAPKMFSLSSNSASSSSARTCHGEESYSSPSLVRSPLSTQWRARLEGVHCVLQMELMLVHDVQMRIVCFDTDAECMSTAAVLTLQNHPPRSRAARQARSPLIPAADHVRPLDPCG